MAVYCKHPKPINTKLYNKIKKRVKRTVKRWPSAYASGQLVRQYKQKGGKYKCARKGKYSLSRKGRKRSRKNAFGSLDRWFKERWVNVCKKGLPACGRKKSSSKNYPYCRPLKRINSKTPRTVKELSRSEIKRRCSKKHRIKEKTLKFGRKLIGLNESIYLKRILNGNI